VRFPALIGVSLDRVFLGGLLSSRARLRFPCQVHSATEALVRPGNSSERQLLKSRVSQKRAHPTQTPTARASNFIAFHRVCDGPHTGPTQKRRKQKMHDER
jgi:hypothetical protein